MSDINPLGPKENDKGSGKGDSNVFLDLNKPDDATGVPSIPLGLSEESDLGGLGMSGGSAENSKFNGQVLLAGLVFTIGVGSIYAMRYIGMQAGIKESVEMVEYTASTNTPDFVHRFETVMSDLKEVSLSVRFDQDTVLPSTPFTMASAVADDDLFEIPTSNSESLSMKQARLAKQRADQKRAERQAKEAEYEFMAQKLVLQSVIGGTRPVARISGEPVGEGMMVAKTFKVLSIKGSVVLLEVDGIRFELGLGSGGKRIN